MSILARLRGRIEEKQADSVIIFAGGLGFEVQAPLSTLNTLPAVGEETTLRTHLYVREGVLGLYGFLTQAEQRLFELLLTVSGVGPKAALNCLSLLGPEQLAGAIAGGDATSLRRVRGLGPKTVDRIVLELKGRMRDFGQQTPSGAVSGGNAVMDVLISLGFSAPEAAGAISALPKDGALTEQDQISLALKALAPKNETRRSDR